MGKRNVSIDLGSLLNNDKDKWSFIAKEQGRCHWVEKLL